MAVRFSPGIAWYVAPGQDDNDQWEYPILFTNDGNDNRKTLQYEYGATVGPEGPDVGHLSISK
jgi:hypothetical protein